MITLLVICFLSSLVALFLHDASNRGLAKAVLSHYWYFSLLWFVAFPLRAAFIEFDMIDTQTGLRLSAEDLVYALLLAFAYWVSVTVGYLSVRPFDRTNIFVARIPRYRYLRACILVVASLLLAIYFLSQVVSWEGLRSFVGNEQNEARVGEGPYFLTAELFIFAVFPLFGLALADHRYRTAVFPVGKFTLMLVLGLAGVMTVAIASRRVIASVLFGIVLIYLIKKRSKSVLLPFVVLIATVLALPLLQILRYLDLAQILSGNLEPGQIFGALADTRYVLTIISSSFEGVDHVARFMDTGGAFGVVVGIDQGVSWLFNTFLAYVPRFIWPGKPLLYGSVAQQYFLYPDMYDNGAAATTLPPSFVVDFSFGFGLVPGLLLAFLLGRFLAICASTLWSRSASPAAFALALYVFVNVFNIVRGGTAFIQSLLMLGVVSVAALGLRETTDTVRFFLRHVFGVAGRNRIEQAHYSASPI